MSDSKDSGLPGLPWLDLWSDLLGAYGGVYTDHKAAYKSFLDNAKSGNYTFGNWVADVTQLCELNVKAATTLWTFPLTWPFRRHPVVPTAVLAPRKNSPTSITVPTWRPVAADATVKQTPFRAMESGAELGDHILAQLVEGGQVIAIHAVNLKTNAPAPGHYVGVLYVHDDSGGNKIPLAIVHVLIE